jgi:hypothetical protein
VPSSRTQPTAAGARLAARRSLPRPVSADRRPGSGARSRGRPRPRRAKGPSAAGPAGRGRASAAPAPARRGDRANRCRRAPPRRWRRATHRRRDAPVAGGRRAPSRPQRPKRCRWLQDRAASCPRVPSRSAGSAGASGTCRSRCASVRGPAPGSVAPRREGRPAGRHASPRSGHGPRSDLRPGAGRASRCGRPRGGRSPRSRRWWPEPVARSSRSPATASAEKLLELLGLRDRRLADEVLADVGGRTAVDGRSVL